MSGVVATTDERRIGEDYVIDGSLEARGRVSASELLQARDPDGNYGNLNLLNSRNFNGLLAHYLTTTSPHLPTVIRNAATTTAIFYNGHVSIPNGDLDVEGVLTSSEREVVTVDSAWDGDSMTIQTESGDKIEFIAE
ncbi:hypothetical protein [Natrinema gelatinilyticum]|uniref:hypothetical protein n=1 Tax=Natrinema gelatinilyticum TaxID=2961571 RepID=UPI0020C1DFED|nr:hypothetical protein [Natrinema gelatinilyticum]